MHPDISTPCNECGVTLTREPGYCDLCLGIPWTHVNDATHGSQADRETEDRIWHCQAARCVPGGHVIQRVRTGA